MKVEFTLNIGINNAEQRDVVDLPDSFTDAEIHEEWAQWIWNYIDGCERRIVHQEE